MILCGMISQALHGALMPWAASEAESVATVTVHAQYLLRVAPTAKHSIDECGEVTVAVKAGCLHLWISRMAGNAATLTETTYTSPCQPGDAEQAKGSGNLLEEGFLSASG